MTGPYADWITEWEGGSLNELVSTLQASALPVRIEVIAPGTTDSNAGEVHLLAGGLADAFAGSLRRDDAMAALQRLEGARFVVECRLPDPESGSLSEPGPREGRLKDRPLASLMRYCEDYVLTCRLEVWRGQDRAVISYRRGEIIGTVVGGSEGSERLPEVMAWTEGSYEIILPAPVLPQILPRKREGAVAGTRKRHTTLSMMPTGVPKPEGPGLPRSEVAAARPPVSREPAEVVTQRAQVRQPGFARPTAVGARPADPLQTEMTTRGVPPVPVAPLVPPSVRRHPVPRPTVQGTVAPPIQPKPSAPAQVKAAPPPAQALPKPVVTLAQTLPKPAAPPRPAATVTPAKPPAVPQTEAPARTAKPVASNDLLPASGTIEAKPKHANQLPPAAPPVQVTDEAAVAPAGEPANPVTDKTRSPKSRRAHTTTSKSLSEHPVRVYVLVGLAIGVGIVLAYSLYLYLPFGHH